VDIDTKLRSSVQTLTDVWLRRDDVPITTLECQKDATSSSWVFSWTDHACDVASILSLSHHTSNNKISGSIHVYWDILLPSYESIYSCIDILREQLSGSWSVSLLDLEGSVSFLEGLQAVAADVRIVPPFSGDESLHSLQ